MNEDIAWLPYRRRAASFNLTSAYLERLPHAQLLRVAQQSGCDLQPLVGLPKGTLVDTIIFAEHRDPAWSPPELRFATSAEIAAALAPQPAAPSEAAE